MTALRNKLYISLYFPTQVSKMSSAPHQTNTLSVFVSIRAESETLQVLRYAYGIREELSSHGITVDRSVGAETMIPRRPNGAKRATHAAQGVSHRPMETGPPPFQALGVTVRSVYRETFGRLAIEKQI